MVNNNNYDRRGLWLHGQLSIFIIYYRLRVIVNKCGAADIFPFGYGSDSLFFFSSHTSYGSVKKKKRKKNGLPGLGSIHSVQCSHFIIIIIFFLFRIFNWEFVFDSSRNRMRVHPKSIEIFSFFFFFLKKKKNCEKGRNRKKGPGVKVNVDPYFATLQMGPRERARSEK